MARSQKANLNSALNRLQRAIDIEKKKLEAIKEKETLKRKVEAKKRELLAIKKRKK